MSVDEVFNVSKIDPWFLVQIEDLVHQEKSLAGRTLESLGADELRALKRSGFADARLAKLLGTDADAMRAYRHALGVRPVFKRVDTCAAEFATNTAYMYSTYEEECEAQPTGNKKIMVLGGGPNRIGQGIEFDYCCVHAALAMREDGYETIMVNCNPETVSTDYDTSDRLYFEPLTLEDVLEVVAVEKPIGVIVQFGGQTPLKLAHGLEKNGVPIIGTTPDMIDCAEDRARFQQMLHQLNLKQPPNRTARNAEEGSRGRGRDRLSAGDAAFQRAGRAGDGNHPCTGRSGTLHARCAGNVQNLSRAHADPARSLPERCDRGGRGCGIGRQGCDHRRHHGTHRAGRRAFRRLGLFAAAVQLVGALQDELRRQTVAMAKALNVVGLMNVQFAIQGGTVYVLEVNPRASRTVPFVSKATGVPLAKIAARCMAGQSLAQQGRHRGSDPAVLLGEGSGVPVHQVSRCGYDTRAGNEIHRRGDGRGRYLRRGLRQVATGGQRKAAERW